MKYHRKTCFQPMFWKGRHVNDEYAPLRGGAVLFDVVDGNEVDFFCPLIGVEVNKKRENGKVMSVLECKRRPPNMLTLFCENSTQTIGSSGFASITCELGSDSFFLLWKSSCAH